jgi:prepilin-type N-terminal cleavage/methylation domain-containing protein
MVSMTIFSTRPDRRRAFTLVEVMIGASLGSIVLAGIMSTFLMLARSGASAVNYTTMDIQSRRALDEFGQDIRMANNVTWNVAAVGDPCYSITLTLPAPTNYVVPSDTTQNNKVTYAWDSTARYFYRKPGTATAPDGNQRTVFIRNITRFQYTRYNRTNSPANTAPSTKRIQIDMTASTSTQTLVAATNRLVSASYILRNKPAN